MNVNQKVYITLVILIFGTIVYQLVSHPTMVEKIVKNKKTPVTSLAISELCKVATRPNNEVTKVTKVIDGDTIDIERQCGHDKVRFIGINTPETVDPRRPVQCFGKEASNYLKSILSSKSITISGDPTQDVRDKYGRLLAYIYFKDTTSTSSTSTLSFINQKMITDGYAYEYTYETPYQFQKQFKQAQTEAKNNKRGLWADETCAGKK